MREKSVLSVQTSTLGHGTYARLLRQTFEMLESESSEPESSEPPLHLESAWLEDGRDTVLRIAGRVLGPRLPGRFAEQRNLDLRRFRTELLLGLMGRRVARRAMRGQSFEALHFHTQVASYTCADVMRRVPTLLTGDMTAAQIAREEVAPAFAWTHAPSLAMDRRVFRAARKIAMWSEWAARSVVEDYNIDAEKVEVVPPGVAFDALSAGHANEPSSADAPVKLLFVGGDFARKGGPELLEVFESEFADRAELHLVTGAPVSSRHPAVRLHRDVQAYSSRWLELYRGCDVFVLPTRREAFGLALTEAMAMGLPVVSTRINAIPEIVAHGETGFLVEAGDRRELTARLRDLIENATLRRTMGERGEKVAKHKFDARRNFARLRTILNEVASAGH